MFLKEETKSENKTTYNWFYGINSIRFILAFIVMLGHSNLVYAVYLKHAHYLPIKLFGVLLSNAFNGTSAVIAFFIISGFVIHYPNKNGIVAIKAFWLRRYVRILIPLIVIIIIGSFYNHPENKVVWSLYCELLYYAIYPFLLSIKTTWKIKVIAAYVFVGLILVIFIFYGNNLNNLHLGGFIQRLFNQLVLCFVFLPCWLLGVLITENVHHLKEPSTNLIIFYRISVYTLSVFCGYANFHLKLSYSISMIIFALLLYKWLSAEIAHFQKNKPNKLLEKFGEFSYSLYLCHQTIFIISGVLFTVNFYNYPILILITLGISYLYYRLIEKPSHLLARKIYTQLSPIQ